MKKEKKSKQSAPVKNTAENDYDELIIKLAQHCMEKFRDAKLSPADAIPAMLDVADCAIGVVFKASGYTDEEARNGFCVSALAWLHENGVLEEGLNKLSEVLQSMPETDSNVN